MIYLLSVLLNVPASPAVSVQAPIPRSGLVHQAQSRLAKRASPIRRNVAFYIPAGDL